MEGTMHQEFCHYSLAAGIKMNAMLTLIQYDQSLETNFLEK